MIVHVVDHRTREEVGIIEVASPTELKGIAAVDWRPIMIGDEERSFRFHGYEWDRSGDEVAGILYVAEA